MALIVFLRGLNVGGHRAFRPAVLARQLQQFGAVNIGAAGTFVIRQRVSRAQLCAEIERRLPFDVRIAVCHAEQILKLLSTDVFSHQPVRPDIVRFVSVLPRRPWSLPHLPMTLPADGKWLLKVLAHEDRFVMGLYRRHMKVIGYLGRLDRIFGMPVTTRNWNTITAVGKVLVQPKV